METQFKEGIKYRENYSVNSINTLPSFVKWFLNKHMNIFNRWVEANHTSSIF